MLGAADAPPAMLAGDEAAFPVGRVAVAVARRLPEDRDGTIGLVIAKHAVIGDVGPDKIASGGEIGWALGPATAGEELVDLRIAVEQAPEALVENLVIVGSRHRLFPISSFV